MLKIRGTDEILQRRVASYSLTAELYSPEMTSRVFTCGVLCGSPDGIRYHFSAGT
ncbi:MAG: hypothetical protein AAF664_13425 [Planctomycetota bacterium]